MDELERDRYLERLERDLERYRMAVFMTDLMPTTQHSYADCAARFVRWVANPVVDELKR